MQKKPTAQRGTNMISGGTMRGVSSSGGVSVAGPGTNYKKEEGGRSVENMEWRTCPYCNRKSFGPLQSFTEHIEDVCDKRPKSAIKPYHLCPRCSTAMTKLNNASWVCSSVDCEFTVQVLPGGKA